MNMNVKLLYFLTACWLFALGACDSLIYDDREGSHETDEGPVVYLSVTKAQAAGLESLNADAADYEDRVHDLALLVFDSATGEKVGEYFDENIPFGVKEKSFTVKLTPGTRDFYFIANMPMTELKAIGSKGVMQTYMSSLRNLDADLYLGATVSKGFPMSRVYLNQLVTEGGTVYTPLPFRPNGEDRINLIRTVAKLEVVIDGGEIHDHRWITVREALAEHAAGQLGILPPTFITLSTLASYDSVAQMVAAERSSPCPEVLPVIGKLDGDFVAMYRGDAGYESGDCAAPGARHRAILHGRCWHYVYRDVAPEFPPLVPGTH